MILDRGMEDSHCGGDVDVINDNGRINASSLRYGRAGHELWTNGFCRVKLDLSSTITKRMMPEIIEYVKQLFSAVLKSKDQKTKERLRELKLESLFHRFSYTQTSSSSNRRLKKKRKSVDAENISMVVNEKRFGIQFNDAKEIRPFFNGLREVVSEATVSAVIKMDEVISFMEHTFAEYSRLLLTPSIMSGCRSSLVEKQEDMDDQEEVFQGFSITLSILFSLGETLPSKGDPDYETKIAPLRQADHQDYEGTYSYKLLFLY